MSKYIEATTINIYDKSIKKYYIFNSNTKMMSNINILYFIYIYI